METLGLFVVTLPFLLLNSAGYYKLFQKANQPGWHAFVPVLNSLTANKITGRPAWEVALEFVPFLNIYIVIRDIVDLVRCFGEERPFQRTLAITVGWIWFPWFARKKSTVYLGTVESIPKPTKPKSIAREWADAIVFAVVAATLIRWLIMEAYTIPTPSMENSLLVGDFLFVSKFHYGTRTPRTPIQIPLTHQKIWFTEIPSFSSKIQLPSYRLPGLSHIKREDVVVFNVPPRRLNDADYPIDLKTNYIKRCVGIAGDRLEIKDRQVIVNGTPLKNPEMMQYKYLIKSTNAISARNLTKLGLDPEDIHEIGRDSEGAQYLAFLTQGTLEELKGLSYIKSVVDFPKEMEGGSEPTYPQSKYSPWNGDNFGPIVIPKKGMTINVNDSTLAFYGETIELYDHNNNVEIKNGKLYIEGQEIQQYTFQQNYYFMMGDNRDNSLDSRYWGYVPEDHVVGKAFFIWLSINKFGDFWHKIRWSRFFKLIK